MKALIIHCSDIHLKESGNYIKDKLDKFIESFQNYCYEYDVLFLVITGDIAYSGKTEEYLQAIEFIDQVKDEIKEYSKKELNIVMIPGNHDCNYNINDFSVRDTIIKDILDKNGNDIDESKIKQCCKVQKDWDKFYDTYASMKPLYNHPLLKILKFSFSSYTIIFYCYNTSWLSTKEIDPYGNIIFPINYFDEKLFKENGNLTLSLFHHPFNWQSEQQKEFKEHIEQTTDIVLTGHEHISSKSNSDNFKGNITEYICGSILQDNNMETSGFNLIKIDLEKKQYQIKALSWNNEYYSCINENNSWISYNQGNKTRFKLNREFEQWLSDPGADFNHSEKKLFLDDIFIWPTMKNVIEDIKEDRKNENSKHYDGQEILTKINEKENKFVLIGEDKSGKTALCKVIYKHYYDNGFIPIYIDGSAISASNYSDLKKIINRSFGEQYSKELLERYKQKSYKKKVLIIDNINYSKLSSKYRIKFFKEISKILPNIFITGNVFLEFEDIINEQSDETEVFGGYNLYKIMEFGRVKRSKIINKWHLIGVEETTNDQELVRIHDKSQELMNMIIGNNFIPSYPIYLLTILLTEKNGQPNHLIKSTYGHYYNYLITNSFIKLGLSNDDIDAYNNYITELAFYIFNNDYQELTEREIEDFNKWFSSEYKITLDYQTIFSSLDSFIFEKRNQMYRIKYKYIYYYFVAQYLANNINENAVVEIIKKLCKELYIEESANILLFLTHHSKDPLIIGELLENAKNIFPETKPIEFNDDIEFLNDLLNKFPKEFYEEKDIFEYREEKLRKQEKFDNYYKENEKYEKPQKEVATGSEDGDTGLEFRSNIVIALKNIEILGQVIKNYYGSMKGKQKRKLTEKVYFLTLSTLNAFLKKAFGSKEQLNITVNNYIEKKGFENREKIEKRIRNILFYIAQGISCYFIKKASQCIGTEKLSQVFEEIKNEMPSNAVKLLDISIKLGYYKAFPFKDIEELVERFKKNYFSRYLLNYLVLEYLYMFPTSYKDKQRICRIVGISIRTQHKIDQISDQKKR